MFRQLDHVRLLLAEVRQYGTQLEHENEELRKRFSQLQNENEILRNENIKLKNEYDECKRNLEKATQEVSTNES